MHLVESYALAMGAKIDKPFILDQFFPTPCEKYITINIAGGMPAKTYFYFQEILSVIGPELEKRKIGLIQLGDQNEPNMGCYYLAGKINMKQAAYVIKNSLLHIGTDSFLVHVAAAMNTPIVALYSVAGPDTCGPYFGDKENQILLEPNFEEGETYEYLPNVSKINTIYPERVIEAVGKILSINFQKTKTLHIGANYQNVLLEVIPNMILGPNVFPQIIPTIRYDLVENPQPDLVYQQIQTRRCAIYTKSPLDINILKQLAANIHLIICEIDENFPIEFIKQLYYAGLPFNVVSALPKEKLGKLKLTLADYCICFEKPQHKRPDFKMKLGVCAKSSKIIFSEQVAYASMAHKERRIPIQPNKEVIIIDEEKFWETADFLYIYEKVLTQN